MTNHLENLPPIKCRVMLSSSLESFSLAYTIVLSRGLIDVLSDEPSLAMIMAHELAHIALGHKLNTKYAFNDHLLVSDEEVLTTLDLARDRKDEAAAKGIEFLKSSPYASQLAQAGLFLRAAADAAPHVPNMFGTHLGNGLLEGNKVIRMDALIATSPALAPKRVDQIAALSLGSRVQVNAWDGSVAFTTRKTIPVADASEKLPFRVTPVVPYLRTFVEQQPAKAEVRAQELSTPRRTHLSRDLCSPKSSILSYMLTCQARHCLLPIRGHYTKRQKSYANGELYVPEPAIAFGSPTARFDERIGLLATTEVWYLRKKEHIEHKPSCVDSHYFGFWADCSVAP